MKSTAKNYRKNGDEWVIGGKLTVKENAKVEGLGGGGGWDAVIHLDEGRWELSGVRFEGMTVQEIWDAMASGKQPRICVYDHHYYGEAYYGVYPVLSTYFSYVSDDQKTLCFTFIVARDYCELIAVDNSDGNGFVLSEISTGGISVS